MTSPGLAVPPAPPALSSDPTLYLVAWVAGDVVADTRLLLGDSADVFGAATALTVAGVAGYYYVSTARLSPATPRSLVVEIPGDLILGESDVESWARTENADPIPAAKLTNAPGAAGAPTYTQLLTVAAGGTLTSVSFGADSSGALRAAWGTVDGMLVEWRSAAGPGEVETFSTAMLWTRRTALPARDVWVNFTLDDANQTDAEQGQLRIALTDASAATISLGGVSIAANATWTVYGVTF